MQVLLIRLGTRCINTGPEPVPKESFNMWIWTWTDAGFGLCSRLVLWVPMKTSMSCFHDSWLGKEASGIMFSWLLTHGKCRKVRRNKNSHWSTQYSLNVKRGCSCKILSCIDALRTLNAHWFQMMYRLILLSWDLLIKCRHRGMTRWTMPMVLNKNNVLSNNMF